MASDNGGIIGVVLTPTKITSVATSPASTPFTSPGTYTVTPTARIADVLVVAGGGGGGGGYYSGGGGGGGVIEAINYYLPSSPVSVTVGGGGAGGPGPYDDSQPCGPSPRTGTAGTNTVFSSSPGSPLFGATLTAVGGGSSGGPNASKNGGSGAGAGGTTTQAAAPVVGAVGYGNPGGIPYGGGGGAGGAGPTSKPPGSPRFPGGSTRTESVSSSAVAGGGTSDDGPCTPSAEVASANTGTGGGSGGRFPPCGIQRPGGAGGSGKVVVVTKTASLNLQMSGVWTLKGVYANVKSGNWSN
jgi:hypothetical protein